MPSNATDLDRPAISVETVGEEQAAAEEDALVEEEILVEEISIDGMCGVY